jgi:hypothetical protein
MAAAPNKSKFLWSQGVTRAEIHYRQWQWIETLQNVRTSVADTDQSRRPVTSMTGTNIETDRALIHGNRRVPVDEMQPPADCEQFCLSNHPRQRWRHAAPRQAIQNLVQRWTKSVEKGCTVGEFRQT